MSTVALARHECELGHPGHPPWGIGWGIALIAQDGSVLTALRNCALMAGVNHARAKTEERHLKKDPTYVAYADYIRRNGVFRFLNREPR